MKEDEGSVYYKEGWDAAIKTVKDWVWKHSNYDDNSDLDPSPEQTVYLREIWSFLSEVVSQNLDEQEEFKDTDPK